MKSLVAAAFCLSVFTTPAWAQTQPWSVDAPLPSDLGRRTFLNSEAVAAYRDKLETLVGYWGVQEGNTVTISSQRPPSFGTGTTTTVKVVLSKSEPIYASVLTNETALNAAIPVLSLNWSDSQRGQITITETAQFISDRLPTDQDWAGLLTPVAGSNKKVVYVELATLAVVQSTVLTRKEGSGLSALLSSLKIGGNTFEGREGSATQFVVSLGVREPICRQLGNCGANGLLATPLGALSAIQRSQFANLLSQPALDQPRASALVPAEASIVQFSDRTVAELLE